MAKSPTPSELPRLASDRDDYVQEAIASWTREAGKSDQKALVRFLTDGKNRLPRSTILAASKFLSDDLRSVQVSSGPVR